MEITSLTQKSVSICFEKSCLHLYLALTINIQIIKDYVPVEIQILYLQSCEIVYHGSDIIMRIIKCHAVLKVISKSWFHLVEMLLNHVLLPTNLQTLVFNLKLHAFSECFVGNRNRIRIRILKPDPDPKPDSDPKPDPKKPKSQPSRAQNPHHHIFDFWRI